MENTFLNIYNSFQMTPSLFTEEEIMERSAFKKTYGFRQEKNGRYRAIFWIDGIKYDLSRKNEIDLIKAVELIVGGELATIRSQWDSFIEWSLSKKKASGTIENYQSVYVNWLSKSELIEMPLKKVSTKDIEHLFFDLDRERPLTKRYWNQIRGTVSKVFAYAIESGIVDINPTKGVDIPTNAFVQARHIEDKHKIFSEFEKEQVKHKASEYAYKASDSRYLAIPLLFCIGARDGEICALKWGDINGDKVHIQREVVDRSKAVIDRTKTPAGNRYIPLNAQAQRLLIEIKNLNLKNGISAEPDDYIFSFEGSFARTNQIAKRLKTVQKAIGFDVLRSPHDIRRTYATELYEHGFAPKKIQRLMGHEKIETTLNSYVCDRADEDLSKYDLIG